MDISTCISEHLKEAQEAMGDVPNTNAANPNLQWLERQLANIVAELQAMLADIEAGWPISNAGFFCNDEFQEVIDDLASEIANLKSMIRSLKDVGR